MSVYTDISEAFLEHREGFGVPITFGATAITAVVAESEFSRSLVDGGWAADAEVKAKVLLSDLPNLPTQGSSVTYQGQPFKVSRIAIHPGAHIGEYTLRPAKR